MGALIGTVALGLAMFAAWVVAKSNESVQASPDGVVTTIAIDMEPWSTPANDEDTVGSLETCVAITNSPGQTLDFDVVTDAIPLGVRDGLTNGFQYTVAFNGAFTVTAVDHTTAGAVLLHRNPGGWTPLDFSQGQAALPWSSPVSISMSDLNANGSEGNGESPPNSAGGVLGRYTLRYNGTLPDGIYSITLSTVGYGGPAGPIYDDPTNVGVDDDADTSVDEDILLDGTAGYGQIALGVDCPGRVGGIAQLPDVAQSSTDELRSQANSSSSAGRDNIPLAGGVAAAVVALAACTWYARRWWIR